jgi:FKBP-type peptidyl-prolyl cis-trans isomerase FkpA
MKKLLALALVAAVSASCNPTVLGLGGPSDPATEEFAPSLGIDLSAFTRLPSGVYIQDNVTGTGEVVEARDTVVTNWTGHLRDGSRFDSGTASEFLLTNVIPGFRDGLLGMRAGGRRRIIVPSALGYGAVRQGVIPPNSTLIFEVELTAVRKAADPES